MITQLTIKNFKKFNELSICDLKRINLIVGSNNVGKTTTLEAIMGFACGRNLASLLNLSVWHRFPRTQDPNNAYLSAELLANAFHKNKYDHQLSFSFKGIVDDEKFFFHHKFNPGQLVSSLLSPENRVVANGTDFVHRQVSMPLPIAPGSSIMIDVPSQYLGKWEVESQKDDPIACELSTPLQFNQIPNYKPFMSALLHDSITYRNEQEISRVYAYLEDSDLLDEFIKELNQSFPSNKIVGIYNTPYPNGSNAPVRIKFENGSRHPIYTLGDGFRRWYELLGGMLTFPKSVHCIEEADATLHHQAQEGFAVNLMKYAEKYKNQIFITTHNNEYLTTFLSAIEKHSEDDLKNNMRVITLRDRSGTVKQRTLNGREALDGFRRGLELRI